MKGATSRIETLQAKIKATTKRLKRLQRTDSDNAGAADNWDKFMLHVRVLTEVRAPRVLAKF